MRTLAIVNPASGGGRTAREWPRIAEKLDAVFPGFDAQLTTRRGEATDIAARALRGGVEQIVAVGGDGTIGEAANGFFMPDGPIAPGAIFAFVTSGTGGDFRKSFGIAAGADAAIARLAEGNIRKIDVGRVSFIDHAGKPAVRHFINIASFGLSGAVVDAVNGAAISKLFGGRFAFQFNSIKAMLTYKNRTVRLARDGMSGEDIAISTVAIANGQYFGGGMRVAPGAVVDDGQFDVIVMGAAPKGETIKGLDAIYKGEHLRNPNVRAFNARRIVASPAAGESRPVLIETDGEGPGRLPATFEILPRALNLRC